MVLGAWAGASARASTRLPTVMGSGTQNKSAVWATGEQLSQPALPRQEGSSSAANLQTCERACLTGSPAALVDLTISPLSRRWGATAQTIGCVVNQTNSAVAAPYFSPPGSLDVPMRSSGTVLATDSSINQRPATRTKRFKHCTRLCPRYCLVLQYQTFPSLSFTHNNNLLQDRVICLCSSC